jgi:hypothetical protein
MSKKSNEINLDEIKKKEQIKVLIDKVEQTVFDFEMQELFLQRLNAKDSNPNLLHTLGDTQTKIKSQKDWLEFLREKQKEYETYGTN